VSQLHNKKKVLKRKYPIVNGLAKDIRPIARGVIRIGFEEGNICKEDYPVYQHHCFLLYTVVFFFFFFSRQGQRAVRQKRGQQLGQHNPPRDCGHPQLVGSSVFARTLPPDVLAEIGLSTLLSCWRTRRTPELGLSCLTVRFYPYYSGTRNSSVGLLPD
jgi:hypothetical protein